MRMENTRPCSRFKDIILIRRITRKKKAVVNFIVTRVFGGLIGVHDLYIFLEIYWHIFKISLYYLCIFSKIRFFF